jgi:predicted transcriptional regulator
MMADPVVRVTVNVSPAVAQQLEDLAEQMGTTKTQALNQAISSTAALYDAQAHGGKIVVENGDKKTVVDLPKK